MANFDSGTDLKKQINLYLDNELSASDEQKLLDHLNNHPQSHQLLQNERIFRDFIRSHVKRMSVTPQLKDAILKKMTH
jgi:hypothetical protein